ncbi:cytochrome P450 52A11 [Rhizodiscina lignyota]|uniref:Cytochrome P450 52A11 n=1 Tax=Rhizodiscina lignyota TaxID=1504668 RepID=A0A9P4MBP8_9PEZI|nr:cytochrome P450 52A11 [Rhizodiscina lignyota]
MYSYLLLIIPLLAIAAWYGYKRVVYLRYEQYKDFPSPPKSLIFGSLKALGEAVNAMPDKRMHTDHAFEKLFQDAGSPPLIFLDMRPVHYNVVVIRSHIIAEQLSRVSKNYPYSTPKSPTMGDLQPIIGEHSIISAQGEKWKALRRTFNAGFAPQYLIKLVPRIVDKTMTFLDLLDGFARSGQEFELMKLTINLTFDIIGAIAMDVDMTAQTSKPHPIVTTFAALQSSYTDYGWQWLQIGPVLRRRRRNAAAAVDTAIKDVVKEKFADVKRARDESKGMGKSARARSVLALGLEDTAELDPYTLDVVTHQIQSFLFAGHDTTAITLAWAFYSLSRTPHALAALRAELDEVLGPDVSPKAIAETLRERGEELMGRLTYTSAVIKETLRLFPPASSARMALPGSGLMVDVGDGKTLCLDGMVLYIAHALIQRDPAVYGANANDFVPERWLASGDVNTVSEEYSSTNADVNGADEGKKIPASAWRPFERGPRNCIGQELANLEARVILACAVRRYDFDKVGLGALEKGPDGKPVFEFGKEIYKVKDAQVFNIRQITSKPFDGMKIRVKFAEPRS